MGEPGNAGEVGSTGERGEQGPPGPAGTPPIVTAWCDQVHRVGDWVTHGGCVYQATRDNQKEPGAGDDWLIIVAPPYVGEVCGAHDPDRAYRRFDIVTFNGAEWRAVTDNPGALPGEGWRQAAKQGKHGPPGPQGQPGTAATPVKLRTLRTLPDFRAVPVMSDGSEGEPFSVRAWFEQYHAERRD